MIGNQGKNWYEDYAMFLKTGYDFSADTRLWYSLNISEFEYGWKDGRSYLCDDSGTTIYEDSVYVQDQGNTYSISLNPLLFSSDRKIKESAIHTVNFTHSIPDFLDITAILAYNDKESATHYIGNSRYKVEDNSLTQADITATYHGPDDTYLITMGIQGVSEEATVTTNNLSDPYNENSIVSIYERTSGENLTLGYFAQLEYTPIEYLTAYLGGRYDKWWGEDADYANIDGDNIKYPDMSDSQFSPKASLVYRPMENGVIRASYGKSFMAPSLYYRTASYYWEGGGTISMADPNPDLGPTTNQSWEIGTEWEFMDKRLRVKATYFENDFEDLVVNQTTTYTLTDGTEVTQKMRVNAEDAEADGIETSIEALLPYNMKAGLFYSHVWSEYTKTQAASKLGWELDETPTDMWSIWIGYFGRKLDMSISYRYSDSRYDDNYAPYADTSYKGDDEYHVVDAKVSYRPAEHVTLSLSVDNLFDEEYYEYYLAPGRTCLGTASFSF
jgi:iron complex outermembrane receptor protein